MISEARGPRWRRAGHTGGLALGHHRGSETAISGGSSLDHGGHTEIEVGSLGAAAPARELKTPAIVNAGDITIGVLAFTFGTNGKALPSDQPNLVDVTNLNDHLERVALSRIKQQIEAARAAGAALIVAHLHWGLEFELFPTRKQQRLARHLCELGIDLILGHHPHVVQPVELYRPRCQPGRVTPICYSLGNLISPYTAPIYRLACIVRVEVEQGVYQGRRRAFVERIEPTPVLLSDGDRPLTLQPLADIVDARQRNEAAALARTVFGPT